MALFKLTIYKRMVANPEDTWTNVYMVEGSNAVAALDTGEGIADLEAIIMGETAEVFKLDARSALGGLGVQRPYNAVGQQTVADPDTILPMWNVVKVTFANVAGRPEIKYLRLPLYTDMIDGINVQGSVRTAIQLDYVGPLVGMVEYVGPNGEVHTEGSVATLIQMRQTGWHRRTRPGFIRGWVPV